MTRQTTLGCEDFFLKKRQMCQCAHLCWSKTTISPSIFSSVSDQTKLIDIFNNIDIVHNVDDVYRADIVENIDDVGHWQRISKDFK